VGGEAGLSGAGLAISVGVVQVKKALTRRNEIYAAENPESPVYPRAQISKSATWVLIFL
jgi:hypothetical protein